MFQCMGKIFCVEFQRVPLKFHTKYLFHTLNDVVFIQCFDPQGHSFMTKSGKKSLIQLVMTQYLTPNKLIFDSRCEILFGRKQKVKERRIKRERKRVKGRRKKMVRKGRFICSIKQWLLQDCSSSTVSGMEIRSLALSHGNVFPLLQTSTFMGLKKKT